eukprot:m.6197 g.6197  ORF g.6197 m.6197 type:complete len:61 (-) comp3495_c0_seq2:2518-2700(-)
MVNQKQRLIYPMTDYTKFDYVITNHAKRLEVHFSSVVTCASLRCSFNNNYNNINGKATSP